jgi:hypothetical protein
MKRIRLGIENKQQVYVFAFLSLAILVIAGWELRGSLSGSSPQPATQRHTTSVRATSGQDLIGDGQEPKLRTLQLARSEQVDYSATGRNIFSIESAPIHIETPIAPPRPLVAPVLSPARPKPPSIDVRYLGYTQTGDRGYNAVLVRGDDSLTARSGEIIFHRFKVGSIQPSSVQLTDLSSNSTQTISMTEK